MIKKTIFIFMISILTVTGCSSQQNREKLDYNFNDTEDSILDFYRQYSSFTDPGDYEYLYKNLPDSLTELCSLVRSQFIHLYAELPTYSEQIPKERWNETLKYPTVKSVLKGLQSYDSRGLIKDRKPKDRLVLGCRDYAVLLASILKYRDIPARVRAGHATYLIPDFHTSHTICEVWNEQDKRWMLVDPNTGMIDFSRDKFDFSNDAWLQMQKNEIDPSKYGIPGKYPGYISILGKVCSDLSMLLGKENTIYQYPPVLDYAFKNNNQVTAEHTEILNEISELMKSLDAENLSKLQEIYNSTPDVQITKTFDAKRTKSENLSDKNVSSDSESKTNKPVIEFVDIPAGTFTMGSPIVEKERKDDEIQHEVSLSAFKMSKYCVTVEQYNLFCTATGRKKPWYGRSSGGKMPVSQVNWYDANAFAEWMGCRLPTEAEFEYATRANTTTPYYTGDCLRTDQANFNGKDPYTNCVKGTNRKTAIPVGSFSANAFGLYDMHGNMVEWCSGWYGEYNIDENINPKGPETGEIKVVRGGGFWNPGWRCRSACRVGDPPGNRGAGLSFRLVKSE
ncbi:MAG: SUMF1/EgtB/PvdO family nonheme iron enzyme [Bacteroidota bacterium]|nr:SUMF1/EgtB/PvdO family nonheme iron enzyme [Bacteroidota bacterium]